MKLQKLEEKVENVLQHLGISKDTLTKTQLSQKIRPILDKWDLSKLKGIHIAKE